MLKASTADANGFFEFHGAPGSYHVYSWSELDGAAYWDPTFMSKYDAQGHPVQLAAGTETSVEVTVLNPEFLTCGSEGPAEFASPHTGSSHDAAVIAIPSMMAFPLFDDSSHSPRR